MTFQESCSKIVIPCTLTNLIDQDLFVFCMLLATEFFTNFWSYISMIYKIKMKEFYVFEDGSWVFFPILFLGKIRGAILLNRKSERTPRKRRDADNEGTRGFVASHKHRWPRVISREKMKLKERKLGNFLVGSLIKITSLRLSRERNRKIG